MSSDDEAFVFRNEQSFFLQNKHFTDVVVVVVVVVAAAVGDNVVFVHLEERFSKVFPPLCFAFLPCIISC